jgi:membrane protease YdiL (CAAX protease family)
VAGSPRRPERFLLLVIALYYMPPLLILADLLPFAWRFQILAVMTVLVVAYNRRCRVSLRELGFRGDTLKDSLLLCVPASLLLIVLVCIAAGAGLFRESAAPEWELFFAYYVFVSSPSQEFLFRGHLFALMRRHNNARPSFPVVFSAATFSFLHIIYGDPLILLATFLVGLMWGWIYHRHPNFWALALSHAAVGAVAIKVGLI